MGAAARLVLGLGVLTAVRLLLAGATDLIPDEAYYDYWSRSLDVCYWDQPGGVAAWNALVRAVFGGGVFAVRLGAIVLSLVTSYFAYDLGRVCLGDRMRAANGVLLAQILPLLSVGAILMLHDALLGACAAMTLAFAARATIGGRPEWWYAAGAAFAAAMYAKFSAVLLAPGLLLFLILSPSDRRHLRRREPYLAGLLAAFLFSPVIFWNMRHGWIALLAVAKLATKGAAGFLGSVGSLAEFIGSQFGLVIPIIFVFMLLAARATWKNRRDEDARGHFFLTCSFLGILAYFAFQSLRARVQGNWAAVAYLPGSLLAADYLAARWSDARVRRWGIGGMVLAGVATIVIHAHTAFPFLPIPPRSDMTAQAHGWREMASAVRDQLKNAPPRTAVLARRYQVCSEMAYYVGPNVEVFCAHYDGRGSQWDLWQDYRGLEGRDVIYADTKGASRKLFTHFDEAIELGTFPLGAEGRTAKTIYLFHLRGFHVDGELKRYFGTPFEDSRRRLLERVRSGDD